jgi:FMN-dependent NADH-azoreductase
MPVLLHLDSSAAGKESISRSVGNLVRADWQGDVIYRDLGADPVPPITAAHVIARHTDPAELSAELKDATALQDQLIDEFLAADAYLFTVPMYNYSVPAAFKAWIDQIVVLGRTLPLPGGTAPTAGRPVVVVSARGGGYSPGTPNHDKDFALPWLQLILADTLGLDLRFITPELTLAPTVPAMEQLVPLYEQTLDLAREQARTEARTLVSSFRSRHIRPGRVGRNPLSRRDDPMNALNARSQHARIDSTPSQR